MRIGKSERIFLQTVSSLIRKQPSVLSWDSLAKDAEIKSHLTISSYIETLESMFVLKTNYFYDIDKKRFNPNKNKKIHFLDNYVYKILCRKTKNEPKKEILFEDNICFNLIKQNLELFYTNYKNEIDFLTFVDGENIGIEVKSGKSNEYSSLIRFKKGFLVNESEFEIKEIRDKKYCIIPIHWF